MTQIEFDKKMMQLNEEMRKEYAEVDSLFLENKRQRDRIMAQMRSLRDILDSYNAQRRELDYRKKDICRKYHNLKAQHCMANPKPSMTTA